jgi:hypothetical protein
MRMKEGENGKYIFSSIETCRSHFEVGEGEEGEQWKR